jgi:hypothetical protein
MLSARGNAASWHGSTGIATGAQASPIDALKYKVQEHFPSMVCFFMLTNEQKTADKRCAADAPAPLGQTHPDP